MKPKHHREPLNNARTSLVRAARHNPAVLRDIVERHATIGVSCLLLLASCPIIGGVSSADGRRWVRSVRSPPALQLADAASLLGGRASGDRLRATLDALGSRGPCADLAAQAARRSNTEWAALAHRSCPPRVHRGVEATVSAHVYTRRPGVGAWCSQQHADDPRTRRDGHAINEIAEGLASSQPSSFGGCLAEVLTSGS